MGVQNGDGTFCETRRLAARDVDVNNKLKLSSVFAIVQETANDQCICFGSGWGDLMAQYNACYILTRMRFEMEKYPGAGDDIVIYTWPDKTVKALFTRYFTIESPDGYIYGKGVSQWALFNVIKRSVMRPSECNVRMPEEILREAPLVLPKGSLYSDEVFEENLIGMREHAPVYTDFDYNRHINNAKYVEWAENVLPLEFFAEKNQISMIDIKYKHEISFDEYIKCSESPFKVKVECAKNGDGAYCIRSILPDGNEGIQCIII